MLHVKAAKNGENAADENQEIGLANGRELACE
jgi:hypothetical protein